MSTVASRRVLATVLSAVAAMLILGVVVWLVFGNGAGGPQVDADVQIIPPAGESAADGDAGTPGPTVDAQAVEVAVPVNMVVYITGEVVNPGVYTVLAGQRLADVVDLAGGPTNSADLERVNLAAHVTDAGHYRIPALGASDDVPVGFGLAATVQDERATSVAASVDPCAAPVNINTASAECLETLPGIGSVRAQSIVSHREKAGPFVSPDGITDVSGIGDGIYGRIADMITVGSQ